MNRSWKSGIIGLLAAAISACAGGSGGSGGRGDGGSAGSGGSQFPSAAEIDRLADKDAPPTLEVLTGYDVDAWELVGPFPERIEVATYTGDTPWETLLAEEAGRRVGLAVPTAAMHCVARELGHFFLANQATPTNGLRAHFGSRCNAAVPTFRLAYIHGLLPPDKPESEIFEQWRADVTERVNSLMTGGPSTVGIWFGRDDDYAVVMAVAGTRKLHIDPVDAIPSVDGRVALTGEVLSQVDHVSAAITHGRYGYADCESDPGVALPRFAFTCTTDPADASEIVTISYTPPGRLLGEIGLHLLVWPGGKPTARYQRPSYGVKREVATAQALRSRFVELLNEVRAEAGLDPVVESKAQSAVASELAPHYFASPGAVSEIVVLGMLAGWSVEGVLQTGHFTAPWVSQTQDVNRLISESLQLPNPRSVLLAPDIDRIAVGALIESDEENSGLAAVVGTYSLFSETEHSANAARVYERFQAERARRELRPAERLDEIEYLSMAAAGQVQAGVSQNDVLQDLLESSVDILQRPVNGWIAEVSKLEDLEFPEDFLARRSVGIAVGVSYHKPADEPWGRYVVFLLAAGPRSHRI